MIPTRKYTAAVGLLMILSASLAGCASPEVITTVLVEVVRTEVVETEVEVTPTTEPLPMGGTVVEVARTDVSSLNPILANDPVSSSVASKIYLSLVGIDPYSGEMVGQIAKSWEISDDGRTYTFHLRDDILWSDGVQLTAGDIAYTYRAILSQEVESPFDYLQSSLEGLTVVDPQTLEIRFREAHCGSLAHLRVGILPSHLYAEDFTDVMESSETEAPSVSAGPFLFEERQPGEQLTLVRNPGYYKGAVNLERWVLRVIPQENEMITALRSGEATLARLDYPLVSSIEGAIASGAPLQVRRVLQDSYAFIALNLADPDGPQTGYLDRNANGVFDEGEPPLAQNPHPILSDIRVRKAIAGAIDYRGIINKVLFGLGVQASSNVLPSIAWAHNGNITTAAYDPASASALLDQAGWVDMDEDGVRHRDGSRLTLSLMVNAENEKRKNVAALIKESLQRVGFEVELEVLDWEDLVGSLLAQQFDMVVLDFSGMGPDPDDLEFWSYRSDVPGGGLNYVSYFNEEVEKKAGEASRLAGCSIEMRSAIYQDIQTLIHEDLPYIFLYVPMESVVWSSRLQGVEPTTWSLDHNLETWFMDPAKD